MERKRFDAEFQNQGIFQTWGFKYFVNCTELPSDELCFPILHCDTMNNEKHLPLFVSVSKK